MCMTNGETFVSSETCLFVVVFFLFFRFVTCVSEGAECRTFGPITKLYKYESGPRSDAVVNKQKSSRILVSCLSTLGEIFISV